MYLLPIARETWVLPYDEEETFKKLWKVSKPVKAEDSIPDVPEHHFLFNGWVRKNRFKLSRRNIRPDNFLPIIDGIIEGTSKGSIVFLRYRMFFATIAFLVFWSIVTMLIALYFYIYEKIYLYAAISFLLGIANYVIAVLNFKKQVKISSRALKEAIR